MVAMDWIFTLLVVVFVAVLGGGIAGGAMNSLRTGKARGGGGRSWNYSTEPVMFFIAVLVQLFFGFVMTFAAVYRLFRLLGG